MSATTAMPLPMRWPRPTVTYEKKAPASGTCGVIVTNPTLKTSSTSAAMANPTGAPAPLPSPMASGMLPPMTVRGAAAATTMNTMPTGPRWPRNRRPCDVDEVVEGIADGLVVTGSPGVDGAGWTGLGAAGRGRLRGR